MIDKLESPKPRAVIIAVPVPDLLLHILWNYVFVYT